MSLMSVIMKYVPHHHHRTARDPAQWTLQPLLLITALMIPLIIPCPLHAESGAVTVPIPIQGGISDLLGTPRPDLPLSIPQIATPQSPQGTAVPGAIAQPAVVMPTVHSTPPNMVAAVSTPAKPAAPASPATPAKGPVRISHPVVTAQWLNHHLKAPNLVIVQVGDGRYFSRGHLPGAQLIPYEALTTTVDDIPGMRRSDDQLVTLFNTLGIGNNSAVIAYDSSGGMNAARLVWTLATLGHDQAALLDGGLPNWQKQGLPLARGRTASRGGKSSFRPRRMTRWSIDTQQMVALSQAIQAGTKGNALKTGGESSPLDPQTILLDVRSMMEYLGFPFTGSKGHITSARHMEWSTVLDQAPHLRLRGETDIRAILRDLDIHDPKRPIVVYCAAGHRASHTWVLLRHLGFEKVRLYDGSTYAWEDRYGHPVER